MTSNDSSFDQAVRNYVYRHFVDHARPPTIAETAGALQRSPEEVKAAYQRLNRNHAFFLEPGQDHVRMANPLSAVPTPFRVRARGQTYWANCAWDAFGIPAMLHCDASIEAVCADCQEDVFIQVKADQVLGHAEIIHFALPFQQWYDDLIRT
jgi:hypothetical protein